MIDAPTDYQLLWQAVGDTVYMVVWTFVASALLGIALGLFLFLTTPGSPSVDRIRRPATRRVVVIVHQVVSVLVNILRSLPFIVLLIVILPLTRSIAGTTLGVTAALVPLTISTFPFFARIIDNALNEVDLGRLEAVESMGVTTWQLIWKVLLPEARSGIIAGSTLTLIAIVGNTAVAGTVGAGGLGDFAIKYGYQRYDDHLMYLTVLIIIVIVQAIQVGGDLWLRRRQQKR